jgi:hypothetical protein
MTHAHHVPARMTHVQPASVVLDDERFVAAVSCGPSPFAATVAGFSIATTASPSADIPGCSSAPLDALAENSFHIPSTNTLGFAAAALLVFSVACCLGVDFLAGLIDLDWGSWEGSLPESSSLGGDGSPLRGAFFIDSAYSIRPIKNSPAGKTLSTLRGWRHFHRHRFAAAWPFLVRQNGPFLRRRRHAIPANDETPRITAPMRTTRDS